MSYTISSNQFDGNYPIRPYKSVYVYDEKNNPIACLIVEGNAMKEIHVVNSQCSVDRIIEAIKQSGEWAIEQQYIVVNLC